MNNLMSVVRKRMCEYGLHRMRRHKPCVKGFPLDFLALSVGGGPWALLPSELMLSYIEDASRCRYEGVRCSIKLMHRPEITDLPPIPWTPGYATAVLASYSDGEW